MFSFALLFALAAVSSAFTLPDVSSTAELSSLISASDCSFYSTLNTVLQCGPQSHLMQYSYKYCQRLVSIRDTFENIEYQDNARQCLQQKLFDQVTKLGQSAVTCDGLKKLDLDSHGSCLAVSFKQLSSNDIEQFLSTFQDTTVNYAQLCKLANSFAGHWSQIVKGDLMSFVKKQLKQVFPEGDTSACSIKEIEVVEEIIEGVEALLDVIKGIKDDILLIIEKAKAIRDDFKTIQQTIKDIKSGAISELDGTKIILEKTKSIVDNANIIVKTIQDLVKAKPSPAGDKIVADIDRVLNDLISIIDQVQALKGEIFSIIDDVNAIVDTVNAIRDGKIDIFDGLTQIVNQVDNGVTNIYSVIATTSSIETTIVDIFDTIFKGSVGDLVGEGKDKVDEVVGDLVDEGKGKVDEIIGGAIGGFGGFGK